MRGLQLNRQLQVPHFRGEYTERTSKSVRYIRRAINALRQFPACYRLASLVVTARLLINGRGNIGQARSRRQIPREDPVATRKPVQPRLADRADGADGTAGDPFAGSGICFPLPFKYPLTYGRNLARSELLHALPTRR